MLGVRANQAMSDFETTLTHDFYLDQHPYRVLIDFERFATMTHLHEWKQIQGTWDLTRDGCLAVSYMYVRELRRTQRMKGRSCLGRWAEGVLAYNQRDGDLKKNVVSRFTFRTDFLQWQKGGKSMQVRTVTREEIDPIPSFNHKAYSVESSMNLIGNIGVELESFLRCST